MGVEPAERRCAVWHLEQQHDFVFIAGEKANFNQKLKSTQNGMKHSEMPEKKSEKK